MRWSYRCPACGARYPIEPGVYLCGPCAAKRLPNRPLEGLLECVWEGEVPRGTDVPLPVAREFFPPIPVGGTPLWAPARLRNELGFPLLFLKDDTCEPTGSFKDRASALVAAFAREKGIREIVLASTGNAASSMAGVGAAAGLEVTVFLPNSAPVAKRIQVLQYGATLRGVDGNYDLAYELSLEHSTRTGALSRNTAYNPLTIEGKKTVSFEISADLARATASATRVVAGAAHTESWTAPDEVFVPTGDGVILCGVYKGFEDLRKLGRITRIPRIWACQAEGSSAIARALEAGSFGEPVLSATLADSIAVDLPRGGSLALAKLRAHGGRAVVVSDQEISAAQCLLASRAGLFAEPSSSAALAGFMKAKPFLDPGSTVVLLVTGSGLKDIRAAARAVGVDA
jgi:threonine synthase